MQKETTTTPDFEDFSKNNIIKLLSVEGSEKALLFQKAKEIKEKYVGKNVYFRGLIEYSNICSKNCYYCGVRAGNTKVERYCLTEQEVLLAAQFAHNNRFGSIVIQSGERNDKEFINTIDNIIKKIMELSNDKLRITLSLGEQNEDTYKRWFDSGANRYLLRIETSSRELYGKLHPQDAHHSYNVRIEALESLKRIGYQTGTGIMAGLPFQTLSDLADDLIFFKQKDFHMYGIGPYIEHQDTPLYQYRDLLQSKQQRLELCLKILSILRIMMKDVNIAATTAMQAIDPVGREKALNIAANVIMPNITPTRYREDYLLYEGKPCTAEDIDDCLPCLEARIRMSGATVAYNEWGDSKHYNIKN
jgi:biotin synthase